MVRFIKRFAIQGLPLLGALGGCVVFSPEPAQYSSIDDVRPRLDLAETQAAKMPHYVPVTQRVLMYLPNRLFDVLDLVKVSVGAGPGVGLEIYLSENIWASYLNNRTWRLGWDGRSAGVYDEGHFKSWRLNDWHLHNPKGELSDGRVRIWTTSNLRPFQAPLYDGVPAIGEVRKNTWDIGARLHFLLGAELLVRPFEVLDLIVGLWGDDIAGDDYGLRDYPLHEYAPQSSIVELFINALDSLNEADLRKALSSRLVKNTLLRREGKILRLDPSGTGSGLSSYHQTGEPPVGDRGKDFALIDGIRLTPEDYRTEDGRLDLDVRCTNAVLRWGYPAQFTYRVRFINRYVHSAKEYILTLELEASPYQEGNHWVITEFLEVPGQLD